MKLFIIGAGGTASYLLPVLVRSIPTPKTNDQIDEIIIIDRDAVETKNVLRQHYEFSDVGAPKAEVLARSLQDHCNVHICSRLEWLTNQSAIDPNSFIISCTDNHPARLALLDLCDDTGSQAVICGNETFSADAYYYHPSFKGTMLDPRIRYPEILTDKSDDPTRPPCNSAQALQSNPQLAAANSMSANLGMHLTQLWLLEIHRFNLKECIQDLPIELSSCTTTIRTTTYGTLSATPVPAS